ncbi:MAG: hypothetical protein H6673_10845 [Anaerolineales bacterium]|nr:hypothetical protein [Anaerolineales bacterium]
MFIVAGILIVGFVVAHLIWVWQQPVPLSLGLVGLGALNSLAGWIAVWSGFAPAILVVGIGLASVSLGMVIHDYATASTPHWTQHAIRVGICIFLLGLLVL